MPLRNLCLLTCLIATITANAVRDPFQTEDNADAESRPLGFELLRINYAKATDIAILLKDEHASLLSKRGALRVDVRTNTLWVQDSKARRATIRKLVKQLDVPVKQVLIEARIVDVTKEFSRDLGISWGLRRPMVPTNSQPNVTMMADGLAAEQARPLADRLNIDLAAAPSLAEAATLGFALATLGPGVILDLELSAMESEGRGEVIARPRLITMNQQPALIESGEEIPYQEGTSSGATVVAFKKAVLSLKVTPHISPDANIRLDLQINQDTPSLKKINGVPSIYTKEVQTSVFVKDGQTIVLGGIYKQEKDSSVNRLPWLGRLPLVKALFRNQSRMRRDEELLIFITPRIMNETGDK